MSTMSPFRDDSESSSLAVYAPAGEDELEWSEADLYEDVELEEPELYGEHDHAHEEHFLYEEPLTEAELRRETPTGAVGLEEEISSSRLGWPGASPAQLAFMAAVYNRAVSAAIASGRHFIGDLPPSELAAVEGSHRARKDAAKAAQALLAAARADLAAAGLADRVRIGITSAYRSAERQFSIWMGEGGGGRRGFPYYYTATESARRRTGDEHGAAAAALLAQHMGRWIAAPGFSDHNDGLAFDFGTGEVAKGLGKIGKKAWFHGWLVANAGRFGFIPYDREPWHWEYRPGAQRELVGEAEEWLGFGVPSVGAGVSAGRLELPNVALLKTHRGTGPALVLRWNDMSSAPEAIDVVVHLHGYSRAGMTLPKHVEPFSGLDLAPVDGAPGQGRSRPTLTVLPRGHFTGVLMKGSKSVYKYFFPALTPKGKVTELVAFALDEFARQVGGTRPGVARLILTAHSGGGAPLLQILGHLDPHEVHVHDGLYQDATALARWAARHLAQDAAAPSDPAALRAYMAERGGGVRVFVGATTRTHSRALATALERELAKAPALRAWYRVEETPTGHMQIPRRYGWRILADLSADVPEAKRMAPAARRREHEVDEELDLEQALALGETAFEDEELEAYEDVESYEDYEDEGPLSDEELEEAMALEETSAEHDELLFEVDEVEDELAAAATAAYEEEAGEVELGEAEAFEGLELEAPGDVVAFPSGAALRIVARTAPQGDEHYDPNGSGNPLLDTSAAVRSTKLSPNFTAGELAQSGGRRFARARIDPQLVTLLQAIRDRVGKGVKVTSGYRPYLYNIEIYKARKQKPTLSQHSSGRAADISIAGMTGIEIAKLALDVGGPEIGVGIGPNYAHVDVRGRFAVWTYISGDRGQAAVREIVAYRRSKSSSKELEWIPRLPWVWPPPGGTWKGKWVVLVAGFDYERHGVDFEKLARNRIRVLIRRHEAAQRTAKATVAQAIEAAPKFVLFDVKSGLVRTYTASSPKGAWSWTEIARFQPVGAVNYSARADGRRVFDTDQAGRMSILDVYEHVRGIGRTDPGRLSELSFLAHGWVGGPILVNSDDGQPAAAARDPNDKDPRLLKDFRSPTMDGTALGEFRAAFASDGRVWTWGCAFSPSPRQVLHRVLSTRKYRAAKLADLKDTDTFRLSFPREHAELFFHVDPFFPTPDPATGLHPLTFDRTLAQLKTFFGGRLRSTYCKVIAAAAGVPCFGALPGTYSDYEKGGATPVMVVPTKVPPYSDDFTRYIRFYTHFLGVQLDPEGRNYGRYDP